MTALGHPAHAQFRDGSVVPIPAVPDTHLLPGVAETLRDVSEATCEVDGVTYRYANGVLTFSSPRGARVEVALLVDYFVVEVNDIVVASNITHPDQVEHERLRAAVAAAFRAMNGLAAAIEQRRDDDRRAQEQAVQRALDSL